MVRCSIPGCGVGLLLSAGQLSAWTPALGAQLQYAERSREKQGIKSGFALCVTLPEGRELQSKASSDEVKASE